MTVFARVATARSFSAAARELGISQATASKHVQTLEASLGIRLLHRTTRRVALTDAGVNFYMQCLRILEDMENAWQTGHTESRLRGSLRVAAPVLFGDLRLAPLLTEFMRQHPDLSMTVNLLDRPVDVVEERWDLAIRIGSALSALSEGPGVVAHRLVPLRVVLCASPQFLTTIRMPQNPADLTRLACLLEDGPRADTIWRFKGPDGAVETVVNGRLRTSSALMRRDAARAGIGLMLAPEFLVLDDLATGRLVRVLPDHEAEDMRVEAVCPADRVVSLRVDRLIAFLKEQLNI